MVKENNGKAARRRIWYQRLGGLCCLTTLLVVLLLLLELTTGSSGSHNNKNNSSNRGSRRSQFRDTWFGQHGKNKNNLRPRPKEDDDNDPAMDKELVLQDILEGTLTLIDVLPSAERIRQWKNNDHHHLNYHGLFRGIFCRIDWSSHEKDPSLTPMFRDVISFSDCNEPGHRPEMDLYEVAQAVQTYDQGLSLSENKNSEDSFVHTTELSGVVFHESRCGSTLLANLLQWHNPTENLVYSESPPPVTVMRAFEDANESEHELPIQVLRDVVHLMSRTALPDKKRVFFKIQSIGTLSLPLFRRAFPDTPYVFVYRDPVEVMISHLEQGGKHANCVRSQYGRHIPEPIQTVVANYDPDQAKNIHNLYYEGYCAAHLAALTEKAAAQLELERANGSAVGAAVNYKDLPHTFWDTILPELWHIPVDQEAKARMMASSTSYSKGRGSKAKETFHNDSHEKQQKASANIKRAAATFLQPSFHKLEALSVPTTMDNKDEGGAQQ